MEMSRFSQQNSEPESEILQDQECQIWLRVSGAKLRKNENKQKPANRKQSWWLVEAFPSKQRKGKKCKILKNLKA